MNAAAGRIRGNSGGGALLEVRDLAVEFPGSEGALQAVNGVSFDVAQGETLGIVGESGCGKSTLARALMQLVPAPGVISRGSIRLDGTDIVSLRANEMRRIRGNKVAMIFQDPMTALNPVMTIGAQLKEAIGVHARLGAEATKRRAAELLELVGIPDPVSRLEVYPHQMSGGMRQRVVIAMAISCNPDLLIADEPTTALDVTVQAQILDLLRRLRDELSMAIILVSHDLGVMAGIADRIQVMYAGSVVEEGTVDEVLSSSSHPYTLGLLKSLARIDQERPLRLHAIPGSAPSLYSPPTRCPFMDRCPEAFAECESVNPSLVEITPGHSVACLARIGQGAMSLGMPTTKRRAASHD